MKSDGSAGAPGSRGSRYDGALANEIEPKWQRWWSERETFRQPNPGEAGFDASRPRFYVLDMFPYPSGAGLHVGHPEGYTATDIISRYKRMRGYNVLHPMGYDAFGLPAEQHAVRTGVHPAETTRETIATFGRQLRRFGFDYDWSREVWTIDPAYYKWTQWIWLRAYRSWFDPYAANGEGGRGAARPISELVDALLRETVMVASDGSVVRVGRGEHDLAGIGGDPTGLRSWADLSREERREVLDSHRLAYLDEQVVNWCSKLGTALANEEVIDGKSERGGYAVERKPLRQWMFRITAYADRLLDGLSDLDWPESTKAMQREWIGRSEGAEIDFALDVPEEMYDEVGADGAPGCLRVFTTRPDTIFGATYMVVAPEHPLVDALVRSPLAETDAAALSNYAETARRTSDIDRQERREKTGVFTGAYAVNPASGAKIPVWCADYVLWGYGTGAIMAVPGGDERDYAFAEAFGLPVVRTVRGDDGSDDGAGAYSGDGVVINSGFLDGKRVGEAKEAAIGWLEEEGVGSRRVNYRLRDWLFSRQRYWGEPFPIVFDERGDHHGLGDDALPVELPELDDYRPEESGEPKPLLDKAEDWKRTTAGAAGVPREELDADAPVTRETNTMPGWAGSCWYYLRYCDPWNGEAFCSREAERYWTGPTEENPGGGVDLYVGGAEHATLHLLYARFWHKMLFDLGCVSTPEPFRKMFHQGLIQSFAYQRADRSLVAVDEVEERGEGEFVESATGERVTRIVAKMSKSLRNVVNPDDVIAEYGADAFRLYEMYMGPLEASKPWSTKDLVGLYRFLQRVWRLAVDDETGEASALIAEDAASGETERLLHRTVSRVEEGIERIRLNTAIAAMIEFVNAAQKTGVTRSQMGRFARVLSPFAPHIAEELWERMGEEPPVSLQAWPSFDGSMLREDTVEVPVQVMGKVRSRITVASDAGEEAMREAALSDERVKKLIGGKTVRKVVVVPGRMVNIVAN